jgi:phage protein D
MSGFGALLLPDIYVPTFEMTVEGVPLELPIAKQVLEITVTQQLDPPCAFHFRVNDPKLSLIDPQSGKFTEGTRIEISMGFVGNTKKLIVGEITAVTADFPDSGPATIEVEGFDLSHWLTRGTIWRIWGGPGPTDGMADSTIVSQIANEVGLIPDVDPIPNRSAPIVQPNESNLDFLMRLAGLNNYFLWVDGTTLHFKKDEPAPTSVTLEWHKTLMSFSGRLSTAGQVSSVEVRGWDPNQKQQPFAGTVQRSNNASLSRAGQAQLAKGAGGHSNLLISDAPVTNAQQAQDYAQAIISGQQKNLFTGSGTSVGDPDIQGGTKLTLQGVGRFNGTYTVRQATHTLGAGGYQTAFEVIQKT